MTPEDYPLAKLPALRLPDLAGFARQTEMAKDLTDAMAAYHEGRSAKGFVRRIMEQIQAFERDLDADHEVGIRLVTFGQALTFHVADIGFIEPLLITFYGMTDDGAPVQLIQHLSQISFLLMKVTRLEPNRPKRPIGFHGTDDS